MNQDALPVAPHIVARVVEIAADQDSSAIDLAKIITTDPVLSTQVLKSVNSPFYGLRRKISSIDRAVSFMGIRAVRNLVLCLGVRALAPGKSNYPLELFWEYSLRRAVAAKCLAVRLGFPEVEEIFTMGLCQDLGVLLLIKQGPKEVADYFAELVRQPASKRLQAELKHGKGHDELSTALFEQWEFPEELTVPIRFHHNPQDAPEEHAIRAKVGFVAEAIADVAEVDEKQDALETVKKMFKEMGLPEEAFSSTLDEVSELVTQAAEMLQIKVGRQPSYEEIAQQASQGLLALNMSYQSLTDKLEESLDEQQKLSGRLQELNKELEERALTDELTGLPNRRAFDEGMTREIGRAQRLNKPMSLVIIDVDHFKQFNDTHGHLAGDRVLKYMGKALMENARSCDLPARYGGEEFALILPHTPMGGAIIAAERLRKAIERMDVEFNNKILKVTASMGVTTITDPNGSRVEIMAIRRADDALYSAKDAGRNQVKTEPPMD